jgi:hypothetical protein
MDERLNLTPIQVNCIHKISKVNECRISHVLGKNIVVLVVRVAEDASYVVLQVTKRGIIKLLTVFPQSQSAVEIFDQMAFMPFSFASLLRLSKEDTMFAEKDTIHFSTEQLLSLLKIILKELAKRKSVKDFVSDKIVRRKELLEAAYKESIVKFRKEVDDALEELRVVSEGDALEINEEQPQEDAKKSFFGLDGSEIF